MDDEVYSFALRTTLNEIQNICPDIKNSFLFNKEGEIIAANEKTPQKTITRVLDALDGILERADAIGGVESITLGDNKAKVNLSCVDDFYLITVTSKNAEENCVNTIPRVLIPTVLKLLQKICPASLKRG